MAEGRWYYLAWSAIERVHLALPADVSWPERQKAIREAYPFGARDHHPYKVWLKAQRRYFARFSPKPAGALDLRPSSAAGE